MTDPWCVRDMGPLTAVAMRLWFRGCLRVMLPWTDEIERLFNFLVGLQHLSTVNCALQHADAGLCGRDRSPSLLSWFCSVGRIAEALTSVYSAANSKDPRLSQDRREVCRSLGSKWTTAYFSFHGIPPRNCCHGLFSRQAVLLGKLSEVSVNDSKCPGMPHCYV